MDYHSGHVRIVLRITQTSGNVILPTCLLAIPAKQGPLIKGIARGLHSSRRTKSCLCKAVTIYGGWLHREAVVLRLWSENNKNTKATADTQAKLFPKKLTNTSHSVGDVTQVPVPDVNDTISTAPAA